MPITSYSGIAANANKLSSARKLVIGLSNVYDPSNPDAIAFDGSKNLDGSGSENPTLPVTGTLGVGNGGTGATTFTTFGVLYGNGANAISATNAGSAGFLLQGNGLNAAPGWLDPSSLEVGKANTLKVARTLTVDLESTVYPTFDGSDNVTIGISNTLPVAHGGTGVATVTANGLLYGDGTNAMNILAPGTAGAVLTTNGANAAPTWTAQSAITAGAADKLATSRNITLTVATGANGGVTGTVSTNFSGDVTIETSLASHTHNASDINTGVLAVAQGGTGYNSIDATPTAGSDRVVKSSGVHKRIAYKKVVLSASGWSNAYRDTTFGNAATYRQAIAMGNDIDANTEVVSVKLDGSMLDSKTSYDYSETFTGNGSTKSFTLARVPTSITSVTRGGVTVAASGYSFSGTTFTINEAPNTGVTVVVNYRVTYDNNNEFFKLNEVESGDSLLEFRSYSKPPIDLTVIVGYVSETLETISTQATLPNNTRFTT